jgi:hypothetical protein
MLFSFWAGLLGQEIASQQVSDLFDEGSFAQRPACILVSPKRCGKVFIVAVSRLRCCSALRSLGISWLWFYLTPARA